jgi:hypothetical protein
LTVGPDGRITVPAAVAAGTYTLTYRICAISAPTVCDTATAVVRVAPEAVQPPPSTGTPGTGTGTGRPDAGPVAPAGGSPAPAVSSEPGALAFTGFDLAATAPWALAAILLMLTGAALTVFRRRHAR